MARAGAVVVAALACASVGFGAARLECTVGEVLRVYDGGTFLCRVNDWPGVGAVRVHVTIRGLGSAPDRVEQDRRSLEAALRNARVLRLRNVDAGSYFRVVADVEADGRDFLQRLVGSGLAKRVVSAPPEPTREPAVQTQSQLQPAAKPGGPGTPAAASTAQQPAIRYVKMSELLDTVVDLSAWRSEMGFAEAIEMLRTSTVPPLPMIVFWRDLDENAFVRKDTPIGLSGVSRIPVRRALQLLLLAVGRNGDELEYVAQDGVITVATKRLGLGSRRVTRVYDTGELASPPSTGLFGTFGGMGTGMGGMGMGGMGTGGMGMGGMGMGGMGMGGMGMGGMGNMGMGAMQGMGMGMGFGPGSGLYGR